MHRFALVAFALAFLCPLLASAPAHAQATRTWVSGIGDDANPCTRTAPCKTFAGAIAKTAAGGLINCLDPGGFGTVTITKSITLACNDVGGGILSTQSNGVVINAAATDTVLLRGLEIHGAGTGLSGVRILAAAAVQIEDCIISGNVSAAPNGAGINVLTAASTTLLVSRTSFFQNAGAAILVKPTGGGVTATLDRIVASRSGSVVVADTTAGGAGINLTIKDSSVHGNSVAGISATTSGGGIGILVLRTSLVGNGTALATSGANSTIRVGESALTGNGTAGSGNVLSYGTNQSDGNGNNGTLTLIPAPALH